MDLKRVADDLEIYIENYGVINRSTDECYEEFNHVYNYDLSYSYFCESICLSTGCKVKQTMIDHVRKRRFI